MATVLFALSSKSFAQTEQEQRIRASYILAFGINASQGEVDYWKTRGNLSISQLLELHRQYFATSPNIQKQTIGRSYVDAFGRWPSIPEIDYYMKGKSNYSELMKGHMSWLRGNAGEYVESIKRSYQKVFNRQPNQGEIDYWKPYFLSNVMLIAYHNDYKNKSTKGNTVNMSASPYIVSVAVSAAVANEARTAAGIVAQGGGNIVAQGGGNIVAQGAGNIVAQGGGNIVAAGAGN
jgi:hypothetical protein